ncbi:hypothetical protein PIROE2DRAFT_12497, partial [Piromyces sp. E2]
MKYFLNLILITVFCSFINACFALTSGTKTVPPSTITKTVTLPPKVTSSSAIPTKTELDITYYTTFLKGGSYRTVLPNNVVVDPNSVNCLYTKGLPNHVVVEQCHSITKDSKKTKTCSAVPTTTYGQGTLCYGGKFTTFSSTIPITKSLCRRSTSSCRFEPRMTTVYQNLNSKTLPIITTTTTGRYSSKTTPGLNNYYRTDDVPETTYINNNIKTVVKLDYKYYTCDPMVYSYKCDVIGKIETLPPDSTTTTLPSKTTTTVSLPPKTTTTVSLPPKTTTTVSLPPKTTTTVSLPPKTTTTVSLPPKTTTTVSLPPKTTTT